MGKENCNAEGYRDPTAIDHMTMLEKMCTSCMHNGYCQAAYKKDHWCGNHKRGKVDYENCSRK